RRGTSEKQERAHFDVALCLHFAENVSVESGQREIKENRQDRVRIIIAIAVFRRANSILAKDFVARELDDKHASHIQVEEEITAQCTFLVRAHQNRGFTEEAYKPNDRY